MGAGRERSARAFREDFARFLEEPSREGLREVLKNNVGEMDELDFKREWVRDEKLARHVLGLAHHPGGGCLVVGVEQREDGSLNPAGLPGLREKTEVGRVLAKFLPERLAREVGVPLDFSYEQSEYPVLQGKSFQVLVVPDLPEHAPFMAARDGEGIETNRVYVRRGTGTEEASYEELQRIISRRLETGYSSRRELDLREHLEQLKVLYGQLDRYHYYGMSPMAGFSRAVARMRRAYEEKEPNPNYPEEDFETFVVRIIARKKRSIEAELDIEDGPASE